MGSIAKFKNLSLNIIFFGRIIRLNKLLKLALKDGGVDGAFEAPNA